MALGIDKDVDCALVLVLRHQLQRHLVEPFHFEDEKADAASHELSQVKRGDIFKSESLGCKTSAVLQSHLNF